MSALLALGLGSRASVSWQGDLTETRTWGTILVWAATGRPGRKMSSLPAPDCPCAVSLRATFVWSSPFGARAPFVAAWVAG